MIYSLRIKSRFVRWCLTKCIKVSHTDFQTTKLFLLVSYFFWYLIRYSWCEEREGMEGEGEREWMRGEWVNLELTWNSSFRSLVDRWSFPTSPPSLILSSPFSHSFTRVKRRRGLLLMTSLFHKDNCNNWNLTHDDLHHQLFIHWLESMKQVLITFDSFISVIITTSRIIIFSFINWYFSLNFSCSLTTPVYCFRRGTEGVIFIKIILRVKRIQKIREEIEEERMKKY